MLAELERLAKRVMYPFELVPWGMALGLTAIGMLISCGIGDGVAGDANPLGQGKVERCEAAQGFIWVGGGAFVAGSDRAERDLGYTLSAQADGPADGPADKLAQRVQALRQRGWFEGEGERRQVSLPGFCLARDLVTQAEYHRFVRATGHRAPGIAEAEYQRQGFLVHPYGTVRRFLWEGDEFPVGRAQDPVVLVSYDDALAFAEWRGAQEGVRYRLPSALEWEKAARGPDGRYFPWGNAWRDDGTNWAGSGLNGTSAVGRFPLSRSVYGVEDMAGNVFEFTSTLGWRGPERVVWMKGCSWDDSPGFCRGAYGHWRPVQSRHILFGFRLVRE